MKLSIITVTYRDPEGLALTLESIKRSLAVSDYEIVVVDSSPTENLPVLNHYSSDRIRHQVEPVRGIYAAMNAGIKGSTGEYLWFLNGGDEISNPEAVRMALDAFGRNSDLDMVVGGVELSRNKETLYRQMPRRPWDANLIGTNRICHQSILYRRKIFDRVGLFSEEYRYASDYEHHWRVFLSKARVEVVHEVIARFDTSGESNKSYRKVLAEFKSIHRSMKTELSSEINFKNRFFFLIESIRILVFKLVGGSWFGRFLKPLWYAWKAKAISR